MYPLAGAPHGYIGPSTCSITKKLYHCLIFCFVLTTDTCITHFVNIWMKTVRNNLNVTIPVQIKHNDKNTTTISKCTLWKFSTAPSCLLIGPFHKPKMNLKWIFNFNVNKSLKCILLTMVLQLYYCITSFKVYMVRLWE